MLLPVDFVVPRGNSTRERERQTQRERERETGRESERQREKESKRAREQESERERERDRERNNNTYLRRLARNGLINAYFERTNTVSLTAGAGCSSRWGRGTSGNEVSIPSSSPCTHIYIYTDMKQSKYIHTYRHTYIHICICLHT